MQVQSQLAALTSDHLLRVVRLHVAIILPNPFCLPLLSGLLSVKGIRIVLKNDHLHQTIQRNKYVLFTIKDLLIMFIYKGGVAHFYYHIRHQFATFEGGSLKKWKLTNCVTK